MTFDLQPPLSKECDDEDDCKPSYSGSGNVENDGSGDNRDGTKLKSSEFNIKDTVNVRGLSPPNEKVIFKSILLWSDFIVRVLHQKENILVTPHNVKVIIVTGGGGNL